MLTELLMGISNIYQARDLVNTNPDSYLGTDIARAALTLQLLIERFGGRDFFDLRGLGILDLGCGCDLEYNQGRDPVLPIIAVLYGAEPVVGIDQYPYTGEGYNLYKHICFDLTNPTGFDKVTGYTGYHLVCCNTGIPSLFGLTIERAKRVVHPNGIIVYDSVLVNHK